MRCNECGVENPPEARFCFQCGKNIFSINKGVTKSQSESIYCQKCGFQNLLGFKFCMECGTTLAQPEAKSLNSCPTCMTKVESSYYLCPNCGQSLGVLSKISNSTPYIDDRDSEICPSCGKITFGEYCQECGFRLRSRQSPVDWWYCSRESAIMKEIDPKNQFLIPKESLNESIASFQREEKFPNYQSDSIKQLSNLVFSHDPTSNFCSITKVKCPVCGQITYASINIRPKTSQLFGAGIKELNGSNLIRSGFFYLKNFKEFYIIIVFGVIIDLGVFILGGNLANIAALTNFFSDFDTAALNESIYTMNIGSLLIDFILSSFLLSWTLISLKQIKSQGYPSIDLISGFGSSIRIIVRVLILQLFPLIVTLISTIGLGFITLSYTDLIFNSSDYYSYPDSGSVIGSLLLILFFTMGIAIVEFAVIILTTYFLPAFIFSSKRSIKNSINRGYSFARKYFWLTLGITVLFNFIGNVGSFITLPSYFLGTSLIPILITSIIVRTVAVYRVLSFGWAYDEFRDEVNK